MNTLPNTIVVPTDRIGMLRQWINEDRIINNRGQKLVTNGELMYWLTGEDRYLKDRHNFVVDRLIEYNKKHGYDATHQDNTLGTQEGGIRRDGTVA